MKPGTRNGIVIMGRNFREPPSLDRSGQAVAQALADGFLAGVWTQAGLKEAAADVLGWPYRWLGPVATSVLAAYRVAPLAGHQTVIRIDLTSFFTSVTASRVYGLWRTAGYPEPVAHALAAICSTRTPTAALRAAPSTLTQRAYRLAMLRSAHLPQGAPTSPALANLCAFRLDRRLQGLAVAFDATYARYADDLAFSGRLSAARGHALISQVDAIATDEGFRVHPAKLRVRGQGDRQLLAGLVVNEHPAVPREEYDHLRAILHDAARHGLDAANRDGHTNFAGYLAGRVSWLGHRHPHRAAKLATLMEAALGRDRPGN